MATWSVFFTNSTDPGPQVGDGRPYTAAEWRTLYKYLWARGGADRGVLKGVLNECAVTVLAANSLQVDTGVVMCAGGMVVMEAAETLAPASAPGGATRKDSVIAELDLDGSGSTGQYTVRVVTKAGTAGAYPSLTQTAALWQIRLYNYTIDDAGAITGLSDQRQYLRVASEYDHGELSGLLDDDHTQYLDTAGVRHTKALHDALNINADTLDGYHAADFLAAGSIYFLGMTVLWGGAIGGSDGHRPIVGGSALETWHWANGDLVNGVQTLDSRGKMVLASDGAAGTYPVNATGGATTINIAHTHASTGLTTGNAGANHTHSVSGTVANNTHLHAVSLVTGTPNLLETGHTAGGVSFPDIAHRHSWSGDTGTSTHNHTANITTSTGSADHTHAVNGSTASSLSAAQSVMNPYRAWYLLTYVGT